VLRAIAKAPEEANALIASLAGAIDASPEALGLDIRAIQRGGERRARAVAESLARLAAAAALAERSPALATLYRGARFEGHDTHYGAADLGSQEAALIDRILPETSGQNRLN
jgi:hypothetical protein